MKSKDTKNSQKLLALAIDECQYTCYSTYRTEEEERKKQKYTCFFLNDSDKHII